MKTRTIITLALLVFAGNTVFAGPGKKSPEERSKKAISDVIAKPTGIVIKGQVWNLDGKNKINQPMNGCEITVFDNRYNLLLSLDTKTNGNFSLFLKPSTSYIVIVKKPGYMSKRIKIVTPQDANSTGKETLNLVLRSVDSYTMSTAR